MFSETNSTNIVNDEGDPVTEHMNLALIRTSVVLYLCYNITMADDSEPINSSGKRGLCRPTRPGN
jgi:hypothetical protein